MNIILFSEQDYISPQLIEFKDRRFGYINSVHKAKPGDFLRVGLINGLMGNALVKKIDSHSVVLEPNLTEMPPSSLPLTLIVALPRPKSLRKVLLPAINLGVKHIVFINTFQVEKCFWSSELIQEKNYFPFVMEALELARDTVLPKIEFKRLFKPFVEDELSQIIKNKNLFIAHPYNSKSFDHELDVKTKSRPTILVIGPEGGFVQFEIEKLKELGFESILFGDRILKLEHAIAAIIGRMYL